MFEMAPLLVAVLAFGCVAIIVFVVGRYVASQASMQRRLPIPASMSQGASSSENVVPNFFLASLVEKLDEKKFGIEGQIRTKLRRELIRAGYFSDHAIPFYIFVRLGLVLVLPTITAPASSLTDPRKVARPCAAAVMHAAITRANAAKQVFRFLKVIIKSRL